MTDRVLLGQRGSDWGLWVSKPGQDVKTASGSNLLFDSNVSDYITVLERGEIVIEAEDWVNVSSSEYIYSSWQSLQNSYSYTPLLIFSVRISGQGASWWAFGKRLLWGPTDLYNFSPTSYYRPCFMEISGNQIRAGIAPRGNASFTGWTGAYSYALIGVNI